MIFLDSSVIAHAAGNIGYAWAVAVLRGAGRGTRDYVTDALCLQELADVLDQRIQPELVLDCVRAAQGLVTHVLPVEACDIARARDLALEFPEAPSRVCLHAAVMSRNEIVNVCAVRESGYAAVPGLRLAETASQSVTL